VDLVRSAVHAVALPDVISGRTIDLWRPVYGELFQDQAVGYRIDHGWTEVVSEGREQGAERSLEPLTGEGESMVALVIVPIERIGRLVLTQLPQSQFDVIPLAQAVRIEVRLRCVGD
jgi:hypothetical protein